MATQQCSSHYHFIGPAVPSTPSKEVENVFQEFDNHCGFGRKCADQSEYRRKLITTFFPHDLDQGGVEVNCVVHGLYCLN